MKGVVDKFIKNKGYGFIKGEDQKQYFFHKDDLEGPHPQKGDEVSFFSEETKRGSRAIWIQVEKKVESENNSHNGAPDKVDCMSCGKTTIPRMISFQGSPVKSVCQHCGSIVRYFIRLECKSCFTKVQPVVRYDIDGEPGFFCKNCDKQIPVGRAAFFESFKSAVIIFIVVFAVLWLFDF